MIVGVDWSSKRIDACALQASGEPLPLFAFELVPKLGRDVASAARAQHVAEAAQSVVAALEEASPEVVSAVWIERPNGFGWYHLLPLLGALTAGIPRRCRVEWLLPNEWRQEFGIRGKRSPELKAESRQHARRLLDERGFGEPLTDDQCEAFLLAVVGERRDVHAVTD